MNAPISFLTILQTRIDKKYVGDPDSPNFLPPSPLIDRQILSYQLEQELKRFCAANLSKEQSPDDDFAHILKYLATKPSQDVKPLKHDKHASFSFQPPKPFAPGASTSKLPSKIVTQQRTNKREATGAVTSGGVDTANNALTQKPKFVANDDSVLLSDIRSKLDSRPKTSAAACIDYAEPISPVSNRTNSNRSNRTAYSTPYTSAGITPGQTSKRFSQSVPNFAIPAEIDAADITALPQFPDEHTSGDPRIRHLEVCNRSSLQAARDHLNTPSRLETSISRTRSRANSFRRSVREYIRPGSSAESIHSVHTTNSNAPHDQSRSRRRISALKSKISNASLRSRESSNKLRSGYDDGDEYFIDADHLNLDRPLPPLPGLDSYRERPKHIGQMMKSIFTPNSQSRSRTTHNVVIDGNGVERTMTADEERQRKEDLARACLEKMSMGSIGSAPTSPTTQTTSHKHAVQSSLDGELGGQSRPVTAGSGNGLGAVPLYKTTSAYRNRASSSLDKDKVPGIQEEMVETIAAPRSASKPDQRERQMSSSAAAKLTAAGGFVKKLGGKLSFKRKPKVVAVA